MGLSNEERLEKFYFSVMFMRTHLEELRDIVKKEHRSRSAKIVDEWIDKVDHMVGKMISKSDSSGMYWLIGPNDNNFRSIMLSPYSVGSHHDDEASIVTDYRPTMLEFVDSRDPDKHYECGGYRILAKWWMVYDYFASVLYPVNRYKDDLFSAIKQDFISLMGHMANNRFRLLSWDAYGREGLEPLIKSEELLLAKFAISMHRFNKKEDPVTKKFWRNWHSTKPENRKDWVASQHASKLKEMFREVSREVADIPGWAVKDELRKIDKEKEDRMRKHEAKKPRVEYRDFLRGPEPMDKIKLERAACEAKTKEEFEPLQQQLSGAYGIYMSRNFEPAKVKKKR